MLYFSMFYHIIALVKQTGSSSRELLTRSALLKWSVRLSSFSLLHREKNISPLPLAVAITLKCKICFKRLRETRTDGQTLVFTKPLREKFALLSISGGADAAIFILLLQGAPHRIILRKKGF